MDLENIIINSQRQEESSAEGARGWRGGEGELEFMEIQSIWDDEQFGGGRW